jgi:hypothetical protein
MNNNQKKLQGQFFTISNPFNNNLFFEWIESIKDFSKQKLLEPFAGSNNIVNMIESLGFYNEWECFDIASHTSNNEKYPIIIKDVLKNYPQGFNIAITNPPYLARNSATRSNLPFPNTKYDDIYKLSLDVMLNNNEYVAAIIPESFLTQNIFHDRLYGVISLTDKMFDDTECPVCLALFNPPKLLTNNNFKIYIENEFIGNYQDIKQSLKNPSYSLDFDFNNPNGEVGLFAVDNTKNSSIKFVMGKDIPSNKVKYTSRSITRIKINSDNLDINKLIDKSNKILQEHRASSNDLFLTAFKGLRDDGRYRRRLDYKNAKRILNLAYEEIL